MTSHGQQYEEKDTAPEVKAGQGAESVVRMLRYLFAGLRILIVLVIILAFFQGVFIVREQEQAMLFRFGRLITKNGMEILRSGRLYWAWPYPIDEVKRIPAERAVTLETTHFWHRSQATDLREQAAAMDGQGLIPGTDGYLLTGDSNIVHMIANVTYRIEDAKSYYLDFYEGQPEDLQVGRELLVTSEAAEALVRNCLENAILKETAGWSVESIIRRSRPGAAPGEIRQPDVAAGSSYLSNAVQNRLLKMVDDMGIGVIIDQVTITSIQPPVATIYAFQRVNDALQIRDSLLKEAQTYENRVRNRAQSDKARILADARAHKQRTVASIQADLDYYQKVLAEYEKNPSTMLVALYTDTIRDVLQNVRERFILHSREDGRQELRLMLGREAEKQRRESPENQ